MPDLIKPQLPTFYDPADLGPRGNANGSGRLYYATLFHWPSEYTHQGISFGPDTPNAPGQAWPDQNRQSQRTSWTRAGLEQRLVGVSRFADRVGHWRMFIGEFSASACENCAWETRAALTGQRPANGGDIWLTQVTDIFKNKGWTWTYHSLNGAGFWDAAKPRWRWDHIRVLLWR